MNARYILILVSWLAPEAGAAAEFAQTFRDGRIDPKEFRLTGPNAAKALRVDSGLRITLPVNPPAKQPVSIVPTFGVHGDFEITLAFDILQVDKPTSGSGAGVSIYVTRVSDNRAAAGVSRLVRPSGAAAFTCMHAFTPPEEKRRFIGNSVPAEAGWGKLRLTRQGSLLSFHAADGDSKEFRTIFETEWGTEDLDSIRFAAESSGSPTPVDVRIRWVHLRADSLGTPERPPPPAPTPRWPFVVVALLVLAGGGSGYWLRRRQLSHVTRDTRSRKTKDPAA